MPGILSHKTEILRGPLITINLDEYREINLTTVFMDELERESIKFYI